MRTVLFALVVLLGSSGHAETDSQPLTVQLESIKQVELGHGVPLVVALQNTSTRDVQLAQSIVSDGYPNHLRIVVENDGCRRILVPLRPAAHPVSVNQVVLGPGETLRLALPPLNRNVLYHEIWNYPGPAIIRVEYSIPRAEVSPGAWWGTVESDPLPITFLQASDDELARERKKLESCVETGAFSCHDVIAYFAAVVDEKAADLLLRLLEMHPHFYIAAKAVVAQGRIRDADTLLRLARNPSADSVYLNAAAASLTAKASAGCGDTVIKDPRQLIPERQ